jgi:hypothetical protein
MLRSPRIKGGRKYTVDSSRGGKVGEKLPFLVCLPIVIKCYISIGFVKMIKVCGEVKGRGVR